MKYLCPTCKAEVDADKKDKSFPFCCNRCKLLDLGAWFDADYKIAEEKEYE